MKPLRQAGATCFAVQNPQEKRLGACTAGREYQTDRNSGYKNQSRHPYWHHRASNWILIDSENTFLHAPHGINTAYFFRRKQIPSGYYLLFNSALLQQVLPIGSSKQPG